MGLMSISMIESTIRKSIREMTTRFWFAQSKSDVFVEMAQGKEVGHRIADYVDEQTVLMLQGHFSCYHEVKKNGKKKPRSMGDVWIESNGVLSPVNVKSGKKGSNGQPNLVALGRLLEYLAKGYIDSYYLLFIKFEIASGALVPHVHLVDLLESLRFTHFNSGPGQIMLKEKEFYEFVESGSDEDLCTGTLNPKDKATKLFSILEEADIQLFRDRQKRQEKLRAQVMAMGTSTGILAKAQRELTLGKI